MAEYQALLRWAGDNGVRTCGISPRRVHGAGLGIVATRHIKVRTFLTTRNQGDEVVLTIPAKVLRTVDTIPKSITDNVASHLSVHGLLAADIALDPDNAYSVWSQVFPSFSDFQACMPLLWDPSTHSSLPLATRRLVEKQQAKLAKDWKAISVAFPDLAEDAYTHAWLLVNTRTFYYATHRHKKRLSQGDRMALQPVADLFNHSWKGCSVQFDPKATNGDGFTVKADRNYAPGEEIFISYGRHSNDFLLAEYGFCLAENEWDETCIDEAIIPALTERQRDRLENHGFLGGYICDATTPVCYRTETAIRIMCLGSREWTRVVEGLEDGESSQGRVDRVIVQLLRKWLDGLRMEFEIPVLSQRWLRIGEMVRKSIAILEARMENGA